MTELHFFRDIGISILGATLFGVPAYYLRVPVLLAYIIAGVVLGGSMGLGFIQGNESISTLSEIGLILLMFILGLELDIRKVMQAGRAVVANGILQFLGCLALGYLFFSALGFKNENGSFELTYLSVACSLSSTLIVVKILSDRMELDTFLSRITLGILVFQDLWALGFLAVQPNLKNFDVSTALLSFSGAGFLIIFCWLAAKFLLPRIFSLVAKQSELMLLVAIAWCFAMCGLAQYLQLSMEMGALLAGLMIASLPYHVDIAAKISSLRDFFITLFFVSLGLQIPKPSEHVMYLATMISLFVLVSRVITMYPVLYKMKYGNRASLLPALNLSQLSEFSLVLGALGVTYGHISPDLLSAFIIALGFTALLSSFIIPEGHRIFKMVNPLLESLGLKDRPIDESDGELDSERAEVVILGFFREASSLLIELLNRHSEETIKRILVVDYNPETHQKLLDLGIKCKYGDISNEGTLKSLRLESTKTIICTIPDHNLKGTTNFKLLGYLRKMAPNAEIIVTATTIELAKKMYEEGADYVFTPRLIAAHYLADVLEKINCGEKVMINNNAKKFLHNRPKEVLE